MGKRKLASAIGYKPEPAAEDRGSSPGDTAPRLLASGRGADALRIVTLAQEAGVAVVEDTALAALLDSWATVPGVRPGDFIPPWCWEAAAKILVFITKDGYKR